MRIGELLKIKVSDVSDRTITLREPKSGKEAETAYMPENMSRTLVEYIKENGLQQEDRLFPSCYSTATSLIERRGWTSCTGNRIIQHYPLKQRGLWVNKIYRCQGR